MNTCSSTDSTPKPTAYHSGRPGATSDIASPIAATSAAMLMTFATSSRPTMPHTTWRGA